METLDSIEMILLVLWQPFHRYRHEMYSWEFDV